MSCALRTGVQSGLNQPAAYISQLRLVQQSEVNERRNHGKTGGFVEIKRSSWQENAQLDLFSSQPAHGVGARQTLPPLPLGGGGYLETCAVLKFSTRPPAPEKKCDPRMLELEHMGLPRVWLDVAEEIGVDAFLATWRILDAEPSMRHKEGFLQIRLKLYRSFLRYQRNRYIEALAARGMKPAEIQRELSRQLCESVSIRHISRLVGGARL